MKRSEDPKILRIFEIAQEGKDETARAFFDLAMEKMDRGQKQRGDLEYLERNCLQEIQDEILDKWNWYVLECVKTHIPTATIKWWADACLKSWENYKELQDRTEVAKMERTPMIIRDLRTKIEEFEDDVTGDERYS